MKKLLLTTIIIIFSLLSFGQGQEGGSDNFTLSLIPGAYQGKIIRCVNSDGDFIWMFLKTIPLDSLNSGSEIAGLVATTDGLGGVSWEAPVFSMDTLKYYRLLTNHEHYDSLINLPSIRDTVTTILNSFTGQGGSLDNQYITNTEGYISSEVDGSVTNEIQIISTTGAAGNISLSLSGGTLNLNVDDADASPTNEVQTITAGNIIDVTPSGINYTIDGDLTELSTNTGATTNDYIPWMTTNNQYKMTLSTLAGIIGGGGGTVYPAGTGIVTVVNGTAWGTTIDDNSVNWNTSYNRSIDTNPTFNTSDGIITFTQQDAGTLTVDIDGRYLTSEVDGSTTNELQTISTNGSSGNITLSNSGGTLNLNVNDADASPTNEIQDLSGSGATLSGYTISLSSDATSVTLPNEADGSVTNEIQDLSGSGTTLSNYQISLSGDATPVTLPSEADGSTTNELNTSVGWTDATNTISVTDAGGAKSVIITGFLESEVDGSITNEIQDLSLSGNILSLTSDPTTVDLSGYLDNATHTGDATGATVLTLSNTGVTAGSYTNTNLTVDSKGRITAASNGSSSSGVSSVAAGSGMNFTTITSTGSVTMGTPSSITSSSTNAATGTTHTHAITQAAADGSTKGIATFDAYDFDASSGNIFIDYVNGDKASSTRPGFLTNTDWAIFNGKQNAITGAATSITSSNLTINRALISNSSGKVDISPTTSQELNYVSGVTGYIQAQLNGKAALNGSLSEGFSVSGLTLPNSIGVTANSSIARLTNGAYSISLNTSGDVTVDGRLYCAEGYRGGSSIELKKNIKPMIRSGLDLVNSLKIKTYNYKKDDSFGVGFIAEQTDSWLSGENQKEHLYQNSIGVLFKALQEEDQKVERLEKMVNDLALKVYEQDKQLKKLSKKCKR